MPTSKLFPNGIKISKPSFEAIKLALFADRTKGPSLIDFVTQDGHVISGCVISLKRPLGGDTLWIVAGITTMAQHYELWFDLAENSELCEIKLTDR
jgi:hypothetical protein